MESLDTLERQIRKADPKRVDKKLHLTLTKGRPKNSDNNQSLVEGKRLWHLAFFWKVMKLTGWSI